MSETLTNILIHKLTSVAQTYAEFATWLPHMMAESLFCLCACLYYSYQFTWSHCGELLFYLGKNPLLQQSLRLLVLGQELGLDI